MDQIVNILERYWKGETSIEEEKLLGECFLQGNIPDELKKYRSAFLWQYHSAKQKVSPSVTQNVLNAVEKETKKQRVTISFYPVMKIAASIIIFISIGIGVYTHYQQEKFLDDTFSETYTNPEDALKETRIVLDKVSSSFSKAKDAVNGLQSDFVSDSISEIAIDSVK